MKNEFSHRIAVHEDFDVAEAIQKKVVDFDSPDVIWIPHTRIICANLTSDVLDRLSPIWNHVTAVDLFREHIFPPEYSSKPLQSFDDPRFNLPNENFYAAPAIAIIDSGLTLPQGAYLHAHVTARHFGSNQTTLDSFGHGTIVATAISGVTLNGFRYPGIAPSCPLYVAKIFDSAYESVDPVRLEKALSWSIEVGARIINLSIGVGREINRSGTLDSIIQNALKIQPDLIIVASVGNNSYNGAYGIYSPASAPGVIAAAAWNGSIGHFSHHPKSDLYKAVTVSAPTPIIGLDIRTNSFGFLEETSAAAAYTSGYVARLLFNSPIRPTDIHSELISNVSVPANFDCNFGGYGLLP